MKNNSEQGSEDGEAETLGRGAVTALSGPGFWDGWCLSREGPQTLVTLQRCLTEEAILWQSLVGWVPALVLTSGHFCKPRSLSGEEGGLGYEPLPRT